MRPDQGICLGGAHPTHQVLLYPWGPGTPDLSVTSLLAQCPRVVVTCLHPWPGQAANKSHPICPGTAALNSCTRHVTATTSTLNSPRVSLLSLLHV